jgi:molecular chaperone DnaK/molecular chaperone HscA
VHVDGILNVAARDRETGNEQAIEVRPSFGLTDAEVEKMLLSSMENAEDDVEFRKLVDARNEADPVLRAAEKKLPDARRLLPETDARKIQDRIEFLRQALRQDDVQQIHEASRLLGQATTRLADLLVKEALQQAHRETDHA